MKAETSATMPGKMRVRIFEPHNSRCEYCGKVYLKRRSWAKFCSRKCHDAQHGKSDIRATLGRIESKLDALLGAK